MGLNSDELARNEYLLRVRRLGFNYLKPAGVDRTMQAVLEDEAEEEEEEDDGVFEIDEDIGGVQFAQDEGLAEDGEVIPSENEEEEEQEEEGEVDLDEAVEEASDFDYDDDDEEGEDQAGEEEDPFMVDEEYDESTTTASTATANSSTRSASVVLQTSEPRTPHLQQQQHRRHPRTSEIDELYFSGIYESDTQRRAAAIAEDLEPASSYIDELGMHRRALPDALTVEEEEEENSDSRTIEDENDGESEMEVD